MEHIYAKDSTKFKYSKESKSKEFDFSQYTIKDWVKNGIQEKTVVFADIFGKKIKDGGLTTSQIRNVFGEMRRIQMNEYQKEKKSLILLKPKLAYAVKRHKNDGLEVFYKFFEIAYSAINFDDNNEGEKNFKNMLDITEAILAYHKFHGGKE
jgi:CRISPR-associated protein Csm2